MTITQAKSITELYEEVKDYDLVLSTEAPLTLALDRRLDHARVGRLAAIPRSHASGELIPKDRRDLFFRLVEKTNLSWKQASFLLKQILDCWQETGDPTDILDVDQFDTPGTRAALAEIRAADSSYRDLTEFKLTDDSDVAVIGKEFLTDLDATILPKNYDVVSPFTDDIVELPSFNVFPSVTSIVDTVVGNISSETAGQFGVVVDRSGPFSALVESAFEAHNIPYQGGPGFNDGQAIRSTLRVLRLGFSGSGTQVSDLRPLASLLGFEIDLMHDEKRVGALDHPAVNTIRTFLDTLPEQTFDSALSTIEGWLGEELDLLRAELDELGLLSTRVTESAVNDLQYYLQSFEVPTDTEREGVLLASATAAAYVDRPVVFYLGLGQGWQHTIRDRPWIDRDEKAEQNIKKFQLLIQNGIDQHFLVQDTRAGEHVTPCLYFQELLEEEFETFTDLPHTIRRGHPSGDRRGFEHDPIPEVNKSKPTETLSQSSLNTFVNSPRDYLFDRLVEGPEYSYFRKGTLYHDFAEFYVNHPVIAQENVESIRSLMLEEMDVFVDDVTRPLLQTELTHGTRVIMEYLDTHPPTEKAHKGYTKRFNDNQFADIFDVSIESPITEQWFEEAELGGHGIVDLIHTPTHLLDYKSGGMKSVKKVLSNASTEEISDTPDFQVALYLAHHRQYHRDDSLEFRFLHFLETLDDAVTRGESLDGAELTVPYYPTSFAEFAARESAYDALIEGVAESNDRRKTLEKLGYTDYRTFFSRHTFPDADSKDDLLETPFATEFTEFAAERVGEYKYVTKGTASALKKLYDIESQSLFKPDLDAFESFLQTQLSALNEYRNTRFPVGDPNPDRLNHPDMILTDE